MGQSWLVGALKWRLVRGRNWCWVIGLSFYLSLSIYLQNFIGKKQFKNKVILIIFHWNEGVTMRVTFGRVKLLTILGHFWASQLAYWDQIHKPTRFLFAWPIWPICLNGSFPLFLGHMGFGPFQKFSTKTSRYPHIHCHYKTSQYSFYHMDFLFHVRILSIENDIDF